QVEGPAGRSKTLFNLAMVHRASGKWAEAVEYLEESHRLDPADQAVPPLLQQLRQMAEAAAKAGGAAQAVLLQANELRDQGNFSAAMSGYREALRLDPKCVDAGLELGQLLMDHGKPAEAEGILRKVIEQDPTNAEAYHRLGNVLQELGRQDDSEKAYEKSVVLNPDSMPPLAMLGQLSASRGKVEKAVDYYRRANIAKPMAKLRIARDTILPPVYESNDHIESVRAKLTDDIRKMLADGVRVDPAREVVPNLFYLAYQGRNDRDLQREYAKLYLTPGNDRPPPPRTPKPTDGRIRVGLLSRFFCNHTIGNLNRGLAAKLNKKEFHLTILSAGEHHDDTNKAFRQAADQYVVIPQSPPLARPIVADQHLDVLFYLDLGMAPFTFSLAFSRLAPVQCVTWGHPLTTGIPTMDYFLSGQGYEGPEADGHYTEQLVRLAGLQTHYQRPVLRSRPRS
ncbi:MAG: tetratricopeptide repeat protein, partial [Planctomycetia bacterium]